MKYLAITFCLLPLLTFGNEAEQRQIVQSLDDFFAAITAKDIDRMRQLMAAEGIIHGYRDGPEGVQVTARTHEEFIDGVLNSESTLVERYWDPQVSITDRMASVVTPFDVYIDGQFSHCGTNHFSMLELDDGWIIAGVVYSIRVEDCEESPLGPFGGEGQ